MERRREGRVRAGGHGRRDRRCGQRRVRGPRRQVQRDLDDHRRYRRGRAARHDRDRYRDSARHMRYLFVAVLGLLIGAAAAGAAIYYNPLIQTKSSAQADAADRALHYSLPSEVLGFALGEQVVPPGTPKRDIGSLWEETIERTAMFSLVLDDAHDKPTAIASRMLAVSPRTDFVLSGVRVNDYWLLTIPGEGT